MGRDAHQLIQNQETSAGGIYLEKKPGTTSRASRIKENPLVEKIGK